jgi:ceramide glucosyltransferase
VSGIDLFLVAWSLAALGWWSIALLMLSRAGRRPIPGTDRSPAHLTVFKPLPPVTHEARRDRIGRALGSFVNQLDERCTLLIGIASSTLETWRPFADAWARHAGPGRIRTLILETPRQRANPKIAWLEQLAAHAEPGVWLWSDADVVAPPQLLANLRAELSSGQARAVTCAYCVRDVSCAAHALDALFVNLEFLPGALLLGRSRTLKFAFGAAAIFQAAEFQARVTWADLGRELADDHALGQYLAPVELSAALVETIPTTTGMAEALKHYYRWQKTVRWCRPLGFAALLLILPLAGWTARLLTGLAPWVAGAALATVWLAEVAIALVAFRILACPIRGRAWLTLWSWPGLRLLTWLAVWLPLPVEWQGTDPLWQDRRKSDLPKPPLH